MALAPISPIIAALSSHTDHVTAEDIAQFERKQDWPGMLKFAQAKSNVEPRNSDWWFLQGYAYARQSKHTDAMAAYQQALRISPEDESSWLYLGYSQREAGQPELAIKTFGQALRYRPESAITYLALADTHAKQGRFELAVPSYRESVRYEPGLLEGWYGLAVAYHRLGLTERRDETLQVIRKLDALAASAFEKQYFSKK